MNFFINSGFFFKASFASLISGCSGSLITYLDLDLPNLFIKCSMFIFPALSKSVQRYMTSKFSKYCIKVIGSVLAPYGKLTVGILKVCHTLMASNSPSVIQTAFFPL